MLNKEQNTKISNLLSMVLRHKPEKIGINLDENGWTDVSLLLEKINQSGTYINIEMLQYVVENNEKIRFAFDDTGEKIRANQGHSISIDLGYSPQKPPTILYHGTGEKSVKSILESGLQKQKRHHVHLSANKQTAIQVGGRHGKPHVFEVRAGEMYGAGHTFYQANNGVWLTDCVPAKFLG